ncbi:MAG: hypothetical protein JWN70_3692 [Planctomycetaceae bacterium]|nr:hypothetical protein [Planctomycetaceae bacterium]
MSRSDQEYKLEAQANAFLSNEATECTRLRFELVLRRTLRAQTAEAAVLRARSHSHSRYKYPAFFNSANTANVPTIQKKMPDVSRLIFMNQPGRNCLGNNT